MHHSDSNAIPNFAEIYALVSSFNDAPEEFERIIRRVYESILSPGECAVDVGAHLGKHSAPLAMSVAPGGRVIALEPIPWAFERLSARATLGALSTLEPRHCCAGAQTQEDVTFHVVPTRPGWSAKTARPGAATEAVSVTQTTVDTIADDLNPIRFLKIDVEGAEPEVLEGATSVLSTARPVVHIEVSIDALEANGYEFGAVRDQLAGHGYLIFDLLGFEVTSKQAWAISAPATGVFDYIAVHPDGPDLETVRTVLNRSFATERLDISAHRIPELLGPIRNQDIKEPWFGAPVVTDTTNDRLDAAFVAGPSGLQGTMWPNGANGVGRFSIAWKCNPTALLIDLLDGTVSEINGGPLSTSVDGMPDTLEPGHEIRIELDLRALKRSANHQTVAEFRLPGSESVGLCRLHRNGRLETLWINDGKTVSVDGAVFVPGRTCLAIRNHRGQWQLEASGASGLFMASLTNAGDRYVDLVIGRRRYWPNPESIELAEIPTTITASTVTARAVARSTITSKKKQIRSVVGGNPIGRRLIRQFRLMAKGRAP